MRSTLLDLLEAAPGPWPWWGRWHDVAVLTIVAALFLLAALARGWRP